MEVASYFLIKDRILNNIIPKDIIKYVIMKYYKYYNKRQRLKLNRIFGNKSQMEFYNILFSNNKIIFIQEKKTEYLPDEHYIYDFSKLNLLKNRNLGNFIITINNNKIISAIKHNKIEIFDKTLLTRSIIEINPLNINYIDNNFIYYYYSIVNVNGEIEFTLNIIDIISLKIRNIILKYSDDIYCSEIFSTDKYLYLTYKFITDDNIMRVVIYDKYTLEEIKKCSIDECYLIVVNNDLFYVICEDKKCINILNAFTLEHLHVLKFKQNIIHSYSNNNVIFFESKDYLWMIKN